MATIVRFEFPAGRYHATPWGHHVNEGLVEWPPSPWRLLRALIAAGYTKLQWGLDGPPPLAVSLFEQLVSVLPDYSLPTGILGHSRHYVQAASKKPLILDAWARLDGPLEVRWSVDLSPEQQQLLRALVEGIGYLGRAESWVLGSMVESAGPFNCTPLITEGIGKGQAVLSPVLCPLSYADYASWREQELARFESRLAPAEKITAKQRKQLEARQGLYPPNLLAALQVETNWLKENGWSQAPGSQRVQYEFQGAQLGERRPRRRPSSAQLSPPSFALFALAAPSRNRGLLPLTTQTFRVARTLHRAIAKKVDEQGKADLAPTLLAGPATILPSGHQHAFILPVSLSGDHRIDHILLYRPAGICQDSQGLLSSIDQLWDFGMESVGLFWVGVGERAEILKAEEMSGRHKGVAAKLLEFGKEWISQTPFVAPRYTKGYGKDLLENQVRTSLAQHRPELAQLLDQVLVFTDRNTLDPRHFVYSDRMERRNQSFHSPPVSVGHLVSLRFRAPVEGPISLGYGSHCGLGLFTAAD